MALTASISAGRNASTVRGRQAACFLVTVANGGAADLILSSLSASCAQAGPQVSQPDFLTPNVPYGDGNPTISAAGSAVYPFWVVFPSPELAGPSPQSGASRPARAQEPSQWYKLQVEGQDSAGNVFSAAKYVAVLSASSPYPVPEGGALYFQQVGNFMSFCLMGAL